MSDTAVTCFGFEDHLVRVIMQNDDPWFVAADVCRVLGIANHRDAVERLDEDERDGVGISDAIGRQQETLIISEGGMYAIVLRSQAALKPGTVAHRFRRWVTSEVLPQIRKTGQYAPVGTERGSQSLAEERLKLDKLHYCLRGFGPVAMRALWKALGLEWVPEMELADLPVGRPSVSKGNYDKVLDLIADRGRISQRDIQRKFHSISKSELTGILDALEAAGQVRVSKTYPPSGGRATVIYEYIGGDTVYSIVEPTPSELN